MKVGHFTTLLFAFATEQGNRPKQIEEHSLPNKGGRECYKPDVSRMQHDATTLDLVAWAYVGRTKGKSCGTLGKGKLMFVTLRKELFFN